MTACLPTCLRPLAVFFAALTAWVGAGADAFAVAKHEAPVPAETIALMAARNMDPGAPILMRAFKKEAELEVWKRTRTGRYVHLKTFPICRWSGQLGPKQKQGDRQTPEGFYPVSARLMNPNSAYYLSFDTGFPNAYDKAHNATGSALMVHGTCSSAGCYAMTDEGIAEIYALAREAFAGGQAAFQFQAFPFRMSAQNIARHRSDPHIDFWRQLKEGADRFDATGEEPVVEVKDGRYAFRPSKDAARESLAQTRIASERARVAALVEDGIASVLTSYSDGGQHASFASLSRQGVSLGMVSRPEALAAAGREIVVIPAKPKKPVEIAAVPLPPRLTDAFAPTEGTLAVVALKGPAYAERSIFAWTALGAEQSSPRAPEIQGGARIVETRLLPRTRALATQ